MPRYSAKLFDSNGQARPKSRYIWAPNELVAAARAQEWLRTVRLTQARARELDSWSISVGLSPYITPRVLLSGRIEA